MLSSALLVDVRCLVSGHKVLFVSKCLAWNSQAAVCSCLVSGSSGMEGWISDSAVSLNDSNWAQLRRFSRAAVGLSVLLLH